MLKPGKFKTTSVIVIIFSLFFLILPLAAFTQTNRNQPYSINDRDYASGHNTKGYNGGLGDEYLIKEIARTTKPGRLTAVHCQDVLTNVTKNYLWDFPHEIIRIHLKYGFNFCNRITIWKEPLKVRLRTMVRSLMHKLIVEDSTECFTAVPDYVLIFKKKGENQVPVTHEYGLFDYAGETPILPNILNAYNNANGTNYDAEKMWKHLNETYYDHKDPKSNKLSHYIWQRYASSVWDDIRIDNVLPFRDSKEEDDEKEGSEGQKPNSLKVPRAPSAKEIQEHMDTHIPFRKWCEHCVVGRALNIFHKRVQDKDEQ